MNDNIHMDSTKRKVKEESCERCSKFILSEIDNVETSDILMTLYCSKSFFSLQEWILFNLE
jgi:hypothetical protein